MDISIFIMNVFNFLVENWGFILILVFPYFKDFITSLKDFIVTMKTLTETTNTLLASHDERISTLERRYSQRET